MLSNSNLNSTNGAFLGLKPNTTVDKIINFVEPIFVKFISEVKQKKLESEEDLTQEITILLEYKARFCDFPFMFQKEMKTFSKPRRVDIGIIDITSSYNSDVIFCIEAKRLPTPGKTKNGVSRKKEYVEGNLGGIERFKRNLHGNGLPNSAILGYIQKDTFDHWFSEINSWIDHLIKNQPVNITWNNDDKLKNFRKNNINARSESINIKIDNTTINMYHLWVLLT